MASGGTPGTRSGGGVSGEPGVGVTRHPATTVDPAPHLPPAASAPDSLLTAARIRSSIEAAGQGVLLGVKFGWRGDDAGAIAMLESALDVATGAPIRA